MTNSAESDTTEDPSVEHGELVESWGGDAPDAELEPQTNAVTEPAGICALSGW